MNQLHLATLKYAEMKATPKRLAILETLAAKSCYISPEELWKTLHLLFTLIVSYKIVFSPFRLGS